MEWRAVLSLGAITLVVIGLVIHFGLKLNKTVLRNTPDSEILQSRLTPIGAAFYACMVGFWVICVVARELRPEGWLGAFVGTVDGVVTVFVGSLLLAGITEAILKRLGYPIAKRGGRDE